MEKPSGGTNVREIFPISPVQVIQRKLSHVIVVDESFEVSWHFLTRNYGI